MARQSKCVKQVIIARKDLKMPPGKLAAQVAHASLGAFLNAGLQSSGGGIYGKITVQLDYIMNQWLNKEFTKICLMVNSEEELLELYKKVGEAKEEKWPCALITDAGRTVFKEPTITCLAIGPCYEEDIDKITGHLKLYR